MARKQRRSFYRRHPYTDNVVAPWLQNLTHSCGVYLILEPETLRVLYVGRSTTKRLKKTLLRHFQQWMGDGSGPVFNRDHLVTVHLTACDDAGALEERLIRRHTPPLNMAKASKVVPF